MIGRVSGGFRGEREHPLDAAGGADAQALVEGDDLVGPRRPERLQDFLKGRSRLPDAELTLRMLHWLAAKRGGKDLSM